MRQKIQPQPAKPEGYLYTVAEAAEQLKVNRRTAGERFRHEPGVVNIGAEHGKRATLRIPQHVLDRVILRRSVA